MGAMFPEAALGKTAVGTSVGVAYALACQSRVGSDHQLESRMRESRLSSLEGGGD
jgi:hypothetical protein